MDNAKLVLLLELLQSKKVLGIRVDNPESCFSIKFEDGSIASISGGAIDYGERDYLDVEIKLNTPLNTDTIIGNW